MQKKTLFVKQRKHSLFIVCVPLSKFVESSIEPCSARQKAKDKNKANPDIISQTSSLCICVCMSVYYVREMPKRASQVSLEICPSPMRHEETTQQRNKKEKEKRE